MSGNMYAGAAEELSTRLAVWIAGRTGDTVQDIQAELEILMRDFDISPKSRELVLYEGNMNERLFNRFLAIKKLAGCTDRTIEMYGQSLKMMFGYISSNATETTADEIRLAVAYKVKAGCSNVTIGNYLRAMSSFYSWMMKEGMIAVNPMMRVDMPKVRREKKNAFDEMDIEKMRANLKTDMKRAIFEVLLSTGCRVTELVTIKLSDIDKGTVRVLGKGNKYRDVYLNAKAQLAVANYLNKRKDSNPYLFPSAIYGGKRLQAGQMTNPLWYEDPELVTAGEHFKQGTVEGFIRKLGRASGVENAHPHRFRRTCATLALRKGMPLELVSKMLGHENLDTTKIYLDLSNEDVKRAHERFVT